MSVLKSLLQNCYLNENVIIILKPIEENIFHPHTIISTLFIQANGVNVPNLFFCSNFSTFYYFLGVSPTSYCVPVHG
jgi:hypothetical protein